MKEMTAENLQTLTNKLDTMAASRRVAEELEDFVYAPLEVLERLKMESIEHLREPRSWGAFVLVGHGQIPIYRERCVVKRSNTK